MKSGAFNTGHCSHFIPRPPGCQSEVPAEVPLLPLHPHPASAYFDKGQSCSTAPSSVHRAAALRREIDGAHSDGSLVCTRHIWWGRFLHRPAGDERSCLRLRGFFFFFSSAFVSFFSCPKQKKSINCSFSNLKKQWLEYVSSAYGILIRWAKPDSKWESVEPNGWVNSNEDVFYFEVRVFPWNINPFSPKVTASSDLFFPTKQRRFSVAFSFLSPPDFSACDPLFSRFW